MQDDTPRGATTDNGLVTLVVATDVAGRATLGCGPIGIPTGLPTTPLADLVVDGDSAGWAGTRAIATTAGARLRLTSVDRDGATLRVHQTDEATGVLVSTMLVPITGAAAFRATTTVENTTSAPVVLRELSSVVLTGSTFDRASLDGVDLVRGRNDWLGENRWRKQRIRDAGLADLYRGVDATTPIRLRGAVRAVSGSSWSTVEELPVAALVDTTNDLAWMWQVEHNGAWSWQVGETGDGLYLALAGPGDADHQWSHTLEPGATFTSVPVTIAVSADGLDGVVAAMTAARRASRNARDHDIPVVFNDYMNTIMGDPTAARLLPLVDGAAAIGADVFVIDAGWYADDGDWWDAVGEWQPSTRRFPDGLAEVLDRIRHHGMVPGLWLEPEVVGVRSPMADKLPTEAFLSRWGHRLVEDGRYHLDLAHPAARAHLDEVVDRLVDDFGVGYFKLDYNIRAGVGTDRDATAAGAGLLRHNRAYLDWIDDVRARHPQLLLENCASGAMRQDFAQLLRHDLQSTSDQQSAALYPPIAAGAPMSVLPEQAASWAYPQPTMTDEQIVFTLVTGLAGRLYLSGFVDEMAPGQQDLVRDAVTVHRARRDLLGRGTPTWPLGFPAWDDGWVAAGLVDEAEGVCAVNVWRRDGAPAGTRLALPAAPVGRRWADVVQVFPIRAAGTRWTWTLNAERGWLDVGCTDGGASARVVMVTSVPRD